MWSPGQPQHVNPIKNDSVGLQARLQEAGYVIPRGILIVAVSDSGQTPFRGLGLERVWQIVEGGAGGCLGMCRFQVWWMLSGR